MFIFTPLRLHGYSCNRNRFLRRLGLAGGNISSRSVQYSFSQGKSLGIAGRETASCKCLPIPKQLCAYTQTAVRLYPISIAKICSHTPKSPLPSAIIHQPSYISHHTSAIIHQPSYFSIDMLFATRRHQQFGIIAFGPFVQLLAG